MITLPRRHRRNELYARVTLTNLIPAGMIGDVHLILFDPANALPGGKLGDNNGEAKLNGTALLNETTFVLSADTLHIDPTRPNNPYANVVLQIAQAHAGDNYIVAVHPNTGVIETYEFCHTNCPGQDGNVLYHPGFRPTDDVSSFMPVPWPLYSQLLTVWRTLHVECDAMPYIPHPTIPNAFLLPPCPSIFLGGFVASELARACVEIREFTPNLNQPDPGSNPMTVDDYIDIVGFTGIASGDGRDAPVPSNDFWTVRVVMTSKIFENAHNYFPNIDPNKHLLGLYDPERNTIFLFLETILAYYPNMNHTVYSSIGIAVQKTLLHEIGHVLIDDDDQSSGVMSYCYYSLASLAFRPEDIREIQRLSRIND